MRCLPASRLSLHVAACACLALALAPPMQGDEAPPQDNPYLAPAGLSAEELAAFLERMQSKPASIRSRPGFAEAIVDATQRLLDSGAAEKLQTAAILTRFAALHFAAVKGDTAADEQLMHLAEQLQGDSRPEVAQAAAFHLLEKRALAADQLSPEERQKLLDELKAFFREHTLTDRHLRLASAAVHVVNLLEDKQAANQHFNELGALFAKSSDRRLARYGKEIAQTEKQGLDLAGKPLEIEGLTLDGVPFDWTSYRGKVVLVDFWATWCGPCLAELPNVLECYRDFHDRGFEVVGISLDESRTDLEEFLRENQVPWPTLFDETSPGWDHPLAKKYGVHAIPCPILVGRDGIVVSESARGPELRSLLERLLGDETP